MENAANYVKNPTPYIFWLLTCISLLALLKTPGNVNFLDPRDIYC